MPDIAALADKYPDLTIVIDHMADSPIDHPEELEKLLALKRYTKLFVKIFAHLVALEAALPVPRHVAAGKALIRYLRTAPSMWATDWPIVNAKANYTQALTLVKDEMDFLNAEDKSWILSKTIEQVWPFPR